VRIAVVGSGISGLTCADRLSRRHDVVLFEADDRLGGHTHTVDVPSAGGIVPVDTGFIVFNARTYPNFLRWLGELGVSAQPSDMSFSVRSDRRDFEYGSTSMNALFSQRRHLVSPRFHRMWRDILRFYREARELLAPGIEVRLEDYLRDRGYSEVFVRDHLLPLVGAVWSSNRDGVRDFPARLLVRFFDHHGFLQRGPGWQWQTVVGGSRRYIAAMLARFRGEVRVGCPVERVFRGSAGPLVKPRAEGAEPFDHVVVACHGDQALALLGQPTSQEHDVLGAFHFQSNDVVLHTDERLMPIRRRTWASWNYHLDDEQAPGPCVTYWMNRLQTIGGPTQYFVTLNRTDKVRPDRVLGRFTYSHPMFNPAAVAAQTRHDELIDHQGVSYCGAYWRNGFHEDGVVSALRVCERLDEIDAMARARSSQRLAGQGSAAVVRPEAGAAL
jgi:predicted NAD/FAD-binding protein